MIAAAMGVSAAQAEELRFVTCPIYRDTDAGKKSGCWLADAHETGNRYDVSKAPSKPDWNHAVLVEGVVASRTTEDACGGVVLDPVRTSILPADCPRHMLEAEGFPGRKFVLPRRNVSPLSAARAPIPGPFAARTFRVFYDFDQSFLVYQYDDYLFDAAVAWLRAAKPRAIKVVGWAATDSVAISGMDFAEHADIAKERAEKIAESLARMGFDKSIISVEWHGGAKPVIDPDIDGLVEPSRRRVDIVATL
ncbi:outer membrane protein OmpA-like peptidoglycan-associated protein [Sphingomonas vulcanisoli]|uniref:Outer membrane protein OmpA-like peptidoglycan-associated protein n=1 Tax=Sphingomonas vulcanisoli TaxID=1658060 RepID=A0ABX0TPW1_9SPHN|nr:OmpA family protein [Sphingomonas vulcanisoli]NIJ07582.1 outer membrane protein OmpA-like peptidoglycan-associated protein [Sphingomonas vulcanisoli]